MRRTKRNAGFTLLEVVIGAAIASAMTLALTETITATLRAQSQMTTKDTALVQAHEVLSDLRSAAFASRRVYGNDSEGAGYFAALDTSAAPPLAGTRLPFVVSNARLTPDGPSETRTGNALLFAVESGPLEVLAGADRYRVDRVRFLAFYLTAVPGKVVDARDDKLDVARFVSGHYVDRASLEGISDSLDRASVVVSLVAAGIDYAWSPGEDADQAFFALGNAGSIAATPWLTPTISADPDWDTTGLLRSSRMSIAGNGEAPRVPFYAQPVSRRTHVPERFRGPDRRSVRRPPDPDPHGPARRLLAPRGRRDRDPQDAHRPRPLARTVHDDSRP